VHCVVRISPRCFQPDAVARALTNCCNADRSYESKARHGFQFRFDETDAEMCMRIMQSEKAAMPYIIGVSVLFGLLLFVALVLFVVLEIQWIKYWSRVLKRTAVE
jgi:hypothetical protein